MDPRISPNDAPQVTEGIAGLRKYKLEIEQINASKKCAKSKLDQINSVMVPFMIDRNLRYIAAESAGPNTGPYYVLSKHCQEGSWNQERKSDYWTQFLLQVQLHPETVATPSQCFESERKFLKQYEKRSIVLNEVTQLHERDGVDRLKRWLVTGE
jgi:hypothetical protein